MEKEYYHYTREGEPVGSYGQKWLNFMEEHHKGKVKKMKASGTYYDVARSVDDTAWEYRELLEKQYMKAHPYPNQYEKNVQYHMTMGFYVDGEVMRSKVLVAVTTV